MYVLLIHTLIMLVSVSPTASQVNCGGGGEASGDSGRTFGSSTGTLVGYFLP